ncbi:MAG: hypothetical protein EBS86_04035, partial [Crocinitomicaceae bacterium]|nr:hypothetical protein [Crocinitomicaceae bacterium]
MIQTNLCAGTYQVTAISDLGCEVTQSYTITEPDKIIINLAAATNNPCFGDKVGSIKVQVTGGVAPYTYAWSNGGTTDNINNLVSGTYTLVVTDANGCAQSFQYTVTSPPQLFLNISGNTSYCAGSSATITVSGSGGVAPYFGTGTFTYLAGTYQLSIKDKNGCKAVKDITIIELPLPKFNIASTNSCKEQTVGTATLTPIIATQPVTYLWSNSQTTQSIINLAPGVYSVTVTDANGCTNSYTTTVFTNATPTLSAALTNAGCAPATNGSIVLTVNQIANNPNVTYLWNTSATTSQLTAIGAGNYSVVVTDNSGCTVTGNYPITNDCGCPLNFSVDICGPSVVCQGESFTLTSNVFPRPQGYPYTYSWTTPLGTVITTPNLTINGAALTASGWYTLTVSLPPNCTYTTQVYVIVRPRPIATISNAVTGTVDNYIHMRTCDIQLTATGGVYYNWTVTSPPILTNHSNQLTLPTTLTSPTLINFRVVAIDSFGCASQQVLHRVRTANPVVSRSINNTSTNPNIIRTLTMNQTTQFANATYTWSTNGWSAGPLTAALKQRTGTIAQLAGIYTLVINQNGCERTFQFELLNNATFTPIIEIGTNKIYINEEIEMLNSEDEFELKAFPNPVSDILTVSFKNPSMDDIGLTITDINGRILMDKNIGNEEL